MTASNFPASLKLTLAYEGGYSNHPLDPGAATMRGVTQVVYDEDRRDRRLPTRDVRMITSAEIDAIYRRRYWDLVHGDDLPIGSDYAVFDFAVNSGVRTASRKLQEIVQAKPDGVIGPKTVAAVQEFVAAYGGVMLSDSVCNARMAFLRSLDTFPTFGKGWTARVMGLLAGRQFDDTGVIDRAAAMAKGGAVVAPAMAVYTPKTYSAVVV
ncbi:Lysozyme family protein [Luteibacter sp. UNC138MFCol5.1]|uniref:glycoside hydrolase family 108 protein n=1 Tax=Luteibacter sp. UNC138MFCol5.1 TaxID=1502774 RepID=UPI0008AFDDEF|nr:glycosyl hydrolase 108 family protein [Luteibacter sp. UNC138MFCol5.1]SEO76596.1 Lysozyme family protein [Luteibacter sp. UNC138MFCol5.1]